MTSDELLGTVLGIAIVVLLIAVILAAMFYRPTPHKKTRSRTTFTHGIDDASVDGDGSRGE
ncbi:hypothetical protein [Pseudophaeobacter sp.]|uniref:hypothetical protein n=1 Tax=Pseudophaeobacter sp. TaxID=1971739 RepID=UPI0032989864